MENTSTKFLNQLKLKLSKVYMTGLYFIGWNKNLRKVSLSKLLHIKLGIPMHSAKSYVDQLLIGERVFIETLSHEEALELAEEASSLGVICSLANKE